VPNLLADPPTTVYLLLAAAAAVAVVVWYRRQTRRTALAAGGLVAALGLLYLLDTLFESPREEAVRRVMVMADAATAVDTGRFVEQLSKSFRMGAADRDAVRDARAWALVREHNVRVAVWGFGQGDTEYPAPNEVEIGFYAKAQTPSREGLIRYVKAVFVRDPDGAYRAKAMRFYTPGVSLKTEDPIPGFP
jgi:hypothetical protein